MKTLDELPWDGVLDELTREGFVLLRGVFDEALAHRLAQGIAPPGPPLDAEISGVLMRTLDAEQLPAPLGPWRDDLYRRLVPLARAWHTTMDIAGDFPTTWPAFHQRCHAAGQRRSLCFVQRLIAPARTPLRQDSQGTHVFPIQAVALLSQPGVDFTGGELVLTEQRPRMQSRPVVVPLDRGDVALIATAKRPVRSSQGYYSVNLRHAIGRVRSGERIAMQLSFHSAP